MRARSRTTPSRSPWRSATSPSCTRSRWAASTRRRAFSRKALVGGQVWVAAGGGEGAVGRVWGSQSSLDVGPLLASAKGVRGELSPCVGREECDVPSGGRGSLQESGSVIQGSLRRWQHRSRARPCAWIFTRAVLLNPYQEPHEVSFISIPISQHKKQIQGAKSCTHNRYLSVRSPSQV